MDSINISYILNGRPLTFMNNEQSVKQRRLKVQNKHQFPFHIIGIHTLINQNSACICSQPVFLDVKSYESNEPV